MKILILGAGGMLGHKCVQLLRSHGQVIGTMRRASTVLPDAIYGGAEIVRGVDADNQKLLEQLFHDKKPDVVINAMGIIKQRDEAKEAEVSHRINTVLPHTLSRLCKEVGAYFITLSTDCVFPCDGQGPYLETSPPAPQDLYGRSKLGGEVSHRHCLTLRMSIIGRELSSPKRSLLEWALANKGKTVQGYQQALYSGVTTNELARIIAMLITRKTHLSGVWHIAGPYISKYELLLKINKIFDLRMNVEPYNNFLCDRRLDSARFVTETDYAVPDWDKMLEIVQQENALYEA